MHSMMQKHRVGDKSSEGYASPCNGTCNHFRLTNDCDVLSTLATISLIIHASTESVESSFSQISWLKFVYGNSLSNLSLSNSNGASR